MNFQILHRSEIFPNAWDNFCLASGGTLNHLTHFMDYYTATNVLLDRSFGVLSDGELRAVVPILLPHDIGNFNRPSVKNSLIVSQCPLISNCTNKKELFDLLSAEMFIRIPFDIMYEFSSWNPNQVSPPDLLDRLYSQQDTNQNLLVDLTMGDEALFRNLSRGHQRTIKKSINNGQKTNILDQFSSPGDISEGFSLYRKAHAMAAGRITRSNESFELMLSYIHKGIASLFIGKIGERNLSFLYCDFVGEFGRGWSQANSHDLNSGEYPRHQTEWDAMKYLGKNGVRYYHLGSIATKDAVSSAKSDSITEYKLRFHPILNNGTFKSLRKKG